MLSISGTSDLTWWKLTTNISSIPQHLNRKWTLGGKQRVHNDINHHSHQPFDVFPHEIMAQIFELCVEPSTFVNARKYWHVDETFRTEGIEDMVPDPRLLGDPSAHYSRANQARLLPKHAFTPVILGHVCQHWRAVSHNTPSLWTSIRVWNPRSPRDVDALNFYLARSQSLLVSVYVVQSLAKEAAGSSKVSEKVRMAVFSSIFRNGRKLKRLELRNTSIETIMAAWAGVLAEASSPTSSICSSSSSLPSSYSTPSLSSLDSSIADPESIPFPNLRAIYFKSNPTLLDATFERRFMQRLCASPLLTEMDILHGCNSPRWISTIPWHQLRVVRWTVPTSATTFLKMLGQCAAVLEECYLNGILYGELPTGFDSDGEDGISGGVGGGVVEFPRLHTLFLRIRYEGPHVLSGMRMPALKHLGVGNLAETWHFDAIVPDIGVIWDAVLPLLERSGCKLESLDIECEWEDRAERTRRALKECRELWEELKSVRATSVHLSEDVCSVFCSSQSVSRASSRERGSASEEDAGRVRKARGLPKLESLSVFLLPRPGVVREIEERERESGGTMKFVLRTAEPLPPSRYRRVMSVLSPLS